MVYGNDALRRTAAEVLERRRQPILAAYRQRLAASTDDLGGAADLVDSYTTQADVLVREAVVEIGRETTDPLSAPPPTSPTEGVDLHPRECFRAVVALADILLADASEQLCGRPDQGVILALVADALTRATLTRLLDASSRYAAGLMNEVHQAQIAERSLIARELHDRLGHSLSAAYRNLEAHELAQERREGDVDRRVVIARESLHDAVGYLRVLIADLRLSQPLGSLDEALANFLSTVETGETRLHTEINGDESWVPPEVLDEVFLVVREALRNAVAHAGARVIHAVVDITPHELRATVVDDGVGFDLAAARDGSGLRAMAERAAAVGGRLAVRTAGRQGVSVELVVPLLAVGAGAGR
ncbi:histidine kinase [Micromonospora sp. NBRC 107095]|uniref:sensor histidine kinase n=1 Tax=Micromonospora sp. NBRC 107095 TaxID=3032209 RepID=UPI0024A51978|nr:histidine kinase [Micromonospora sp. NBRC 107095]GLZ57155.1 two-component sensor histidine kinase [Micromonospora sp. NBRC 107095]